jgi:photosystem II stability/assembly factor-like uncharacterized protein
MRDASLEGLERRRNRKRRNGQIVAGVLALLIAAAGVGGGLYAFRTSTGGKPGDRSPTPSHTAPPGLESGAPSPVSGPLQFIDEQHGWAAFAGRILATSDGGKTWNVQSPGPGVTGVTFVDADNGWAPSVGGLLRTLDGGAHWAPVGRRALELRDVQFFDDKVGWAVRLDQSGPGGALVRTRDGGASWEEVAAPSPVESICFAGDGQILWAAGASSDRQLLMRSIDDGHSWESSPLTVPPEEPWTAMVRCGGIDAWVLLEDGGAAGHLAYVLFRTVEGGPTVEPVLQEAYTHPVGAETRVTDIPDPYPGPFVGFDGLDALFVGSCPPCGNSLAVYRSATGWTRTELAKESAIPLAMSFVDTKRGWLLLQLGRSRMSVIVTSDGGLSWSRVR